MWVFVVDLLWDSFIVGEEVEGVKMFKPVSVIIFIELIFSEEVVKFGEELKV